MPAEEYLEAKYKLGLFDDPYRYCNEERAQTEILSDANRKAGREIAAHSFVLLKNDNQLLAIKEIRNYRFDRTIG